MYNHFKVLHTGKFWVVAGQNGGLYVSVDAVTWKKPLLLPKTDIRTLTFSGGEVLYGTEHGGIGHLTPQP